MLGARRDVLECESGLGEGAPVLDRAALDANTMSDAALQKELFELYFGYAKEAMARLTAALEARDAKAWMEAAHGLKGTARTLGLVRLADIAAAAQAAGETGVGGTQEQLALIADALHEANAAAYGYLGQVLAKAS